VIFQVICGISSKSPLRSKKHSENGIFASATIENPNAVVLEKYVIQNAPPEGRDFLRITNNALFPAWSFPGEQSNVPKNLAMPALALGISVPSPPVVRFYKVAGDLYNELSRHIGLPEIKSPF
jgi:hypothetical protein